MITVINEEKMTLKNFDSFIDLEVDDILDSYIVDYNFSLDRKVIIEFYTMQTSSAYMSDVI